MPSGSMVIKGLCSLYFLSPWWLKGLCYIFSMTLTAAFNHTTFPLAAFTTKSPLTAHGLCQSPSDSIFVLLMPFYLTYLNNNHSINYPQKCPETLWRLQRLEKCRLCSSVWWLFTLGLQSTCLWLWVRTQLGVPPSPRALDEPVCLRRPRQELLQVFNICLGHGSLAWVLSGLG